METLLIIGLAYLAFKKFMPELTLPTATTPKTGATSAQELLAPLGSENPENLLALGAPLVEKVFDSGLAAIPLSNPTNPVEIETMFQGSPGSGSPAPSGTAQGSGEAGAGSPAPAPAPADAPSSGFSLGFDVSSGLDAAGAGLVAGLSTGNLGVAAVGAVAGFFGGGLYGGSSFGGAAASPGESPAASSGTDAGGSGGVDPGDW